MIGRDEKQPSQDHGRGESGQVDPGSHPDAGADSGQGSYWSERDARQPRQEQLPYYRQGGHYQPGRHQDRSRSWQQPPHSYSASNGWQQDRPKERYEWDFQEYDRYAAPKKKRSRGLVVFCTVVICLLAVSLLAVGGVAVYNNFVAGDEDTPGILEPAGDRDTLSASQGQPEESRSAAGGLEAAGIEIVSRPQISETVPVGGKMTIPQVAEATLPSVVGIVTYQNAQFFQPVTSGSGIILSEDGYIITNAHVVEGADAVKVTLHNDEVYEARTLGLDVRTDLAVLKIEETGLIVATFGDSSILRVGETVIAIGNPAGLLTGSVTQGIVSALNRQVHTAYRSTTFIQTDAAINPGSSGGALVNEYGQVIGINSSKLVAEGYEGISFAIPISEAKPILDDLLQNGRVTGRVLLGITPETVDEVMAKTYGVPMGVQILEMSPEADISTKGVQKGDIITHIDGTRVYAVEDVWEVLANHKVGDIVQLTLYRQSRVIQGTTFTANVVLMEDLG